MTTRDWRAVYGPTYQVQMTLRSADGVHPESLDRTLLGSVGR